MNLVILRPPENNKKYSDYQQFEEIFRKKKGEKRINIMLIKHFSK